MTRVKRGIVSKRRHNKLMDQAKGYRGTKSRLTRVAREAVLHAGQYAFHGRKLRKRDMRSLWITRIGEAARLEGTSYSKLINMLKKSKIELNRKILADIIVSDNTTFKKILAQVTK